MSTSRNAKKSHYIPQWEHLDIVALLENTDIVDVGAPAVELLDPGEVAHPRPRHDHVLRQLDHPDPSLKDGGCRLKPGLDHSIWDLIWKLKSKEIYNKTKYFMLWQYDYCLEYALLQESSKNNLKLSWLEENTKIEWNWRIARRHTGTEWLLELLVGAKNIHKYQLH